MTVPLPAAETASTRQPTGTAPGTPPRHAMLLAAGLGTRMRPLTAETAKPLLPVQGRALLDHALDRLAEAGVEEVVVNTHWQADKVAAHLARRSGGPRLQIHHEPRLLDTGGAVAAALDAGLLPDEPFYIVNGDALWLDGPTPMLRRLATAMATGQADATLLLQRTVLVTGAVGRGDFALDPWGIPRRPAEHELVPYLYAGVQIASPALFAAAPASAFSLNTLWDGAIEAGRLQAIVHDGVWFHLSAPDDLVVAEAELRAHRAGERR